ncbi:MAG: GEVED domain-containing protein [Bacteroidetes bacterium]|nr:GEVED domain-containing protein [Bacteroidota bacterium]
MKQLYKILSTLLLVILSGVVMAQYCTPTYSYGCSYGDGLTNFQLGTINQAIPCSGAPAYYHDYTASSTNLSIGVPATVTVQAGFSSTYVTIWIDYNHNNTFDPATETAGQVICTSSGVNYNIVITVPGTALTGATRLRAMTEYYSYPAGPCSGQTFGNCQDFTVSISGGGYCTPTYSYGCGYGDGLTLFQLNTINQPVACNGSPNAWYHDWTGTTTSIMLNTNYTMTVQAGFSSTYVCVWIDYNNDNTFAASERVVTDLICASAATNYTAVINVPLGTTLGNHRMRFRTNWGMTAADPCASYTYGNAGDFTVNLTAYVAPTAPTVVTTAATAIAGTTTTVNGTVNANNASTTVTFDYGLTTNYGSSIAGTPSPVTGNVVTPVSAGLTGLTPNTLYHFRVKGVNSVGTSNGGDLTFTTLSIAPTVVTLAATGVTNVVATMNGTVNANNTSTNVFFDYGLTTNYGTTVSGVPSPVTGTSVTSVSASIGGLTSNTTYHYRVRGVNSAGTSNGTDMTFFTVCNAAGPAGVITGPAQVCNGGTGYTFSVAAIANASGYNWTVPFGSFITGGMNTNSITVSFPNPSYSGNISVYGVGCLGNGSPSYMVVTVNPAPTPTISGPGTACANTSGNVYTTQTGMTGYVWGISAGGVIISGQGTNSITVNWNTPGTQCVNVNYNNAAGCAGLIPGSFCTTVNPMPAPTVSGNTSPCTALTNTYTTQAGMTNYSWTVSAGGTITAGAGTNSITVIWNTTGAQNVYVTCINSNGCTNSIPGSLAVTVKQGPTPTITGAGSVCVNSGYYAYTTEAGMSGYTWAVSAGGTLNFGQGTNVATVTWNTNGPQTISVNYTNTVGCAAVAPVSMPVTVSGLPGAAGTISGPAGVCEGATNIVYSVAAIPNTHAYIWAVPAGATITNGLNSNSITVNFAVGAASGNITVYGNNACGNGSTTSYAVTVNTVPSTPGPITGPNSVCQGSEGVVYSVTAIPGASGYVWVLPTGATLVSGANTNQITVNFSQAAVSGDITVYGTNACGNGAVSTPFAITVVPVPLAPVITNAGSLLTSDAPAGNQWYLEGTLIPGATSQSYTATEVGWYWDVVTLNGCSSAPSNQIEILVLGTSKLQGSKISVYPVPNDGRFTISFTSPSTESFTISILNNLGVEIYLQEHITVTGNVEKVIDLRPVPSGIYSVIIRNPENQVIRKILVNK